MSVMTIPDAWSGQERTLTVEDMENMPEDEFRYELDDGMLIVSPAPSRLHQLELHSGTYKQAAHATGDEEYHAAVPFPVAIVPSRLIAVG